MSANCKTANSNRPAIDQFLSFATEENRERYLATEAEARDWTAMQQAFLQMADDYLTSERRKSLDENIDAHEAGGQWRIAFPHLAVRGDEQVAQRMADMMAARKAWTDANFHHGYHKCHEVHHHIETFIFFQIPLSYSGRPGADVALASIEDVAHHMGNWEADVPAWYDWERHEFVSTWLGTREVRAFPPYDYQEANHFRFTDVAMAAYLGTGEGRYLDLLCDYADRWCEHIERLAEKGEPVRCSILPSEALAGEMGFGGERRDPSEEYKVFYTTVALNTAHDIAGALLDLYRVTGNDRYLAAMRHMIDQFFANGAGERPALGFVDGEWVVSPSVDAAESLNACLGVPVNGALLANLAVRHDMVTGLDRYRQPVLDWAAVIDEQVNLADQMIAGLLVAAHFYDGDPRWLARAYAMALRLATIVDHNDFFHQCNCLNRQGSKSPMGYLYQPLLGGCQWGCFGNIPIQRLQHHADGREGLPNGVAFRTWRVDGRTDMFEAANLSEQSADWELGGASAEQEPLCIEIAGESSDCGGRLRVEAGGTATGRILWSAEHAAPSVKPRD